MMANPSAEAWSTGRARTPSFPHFFPTTNENGTLRRRKSLIQLSFLVGGTGFEPVTPAV